MPTSRPAVRTLPIGWSSGNPRPSAAVGRAVGRIGGPIGEQPEYFLGARRIRPSAPARAALLRARAFTIASTALLALTMLHLLAR